MPLVKGKSKATLNKNFHELRSGKTFHKTEKKHGKKVAVKQMQAIALKTQRKAARKKRS